MEKTRCCYCSREVLWSSSVASLRGGRSSSALWLNDLTIISQQCAGETVLFNDWWHRSNPWGLRTQNSVWSVRNPVLSS